MKPQTEELLYFLLWTAEQFTRPTWRNLTDSFENFAWRNGLARRLAQLERQKLIETRAQPNSTQLVRLTEAGRRLALGGRDPAVQWNRPWDGQWRLVLFDLPVDRPEMRMQVWRVLRRHYCGYLQGSVWVTPDPDDELREWLLGMAAGAETFLLIEGRPAIGDDRHIVEAAWNFKRINRRYEEYLAFAGQPCPAGCRLVEWGRRENELWRRAVASDPLLPRTLLPKGYAGMEALQRRGQLLAEVANANAAVVASRTRSGATWR